MDKFASFAQFARNDPDGWETRPPTAADRKAFQATIVAAHGEKGLAEYLHTTWG